MTLISIPEGLKASLEQGLQFIVYVAVDLSGVIDLPLNIFMLLV